jgi:hypothetical protein
MHWLEWIWEFKLVGEDKGLGFLSVNQKIPTGSQMHHIIQGTWPGTVGLSQRELDCNYFASKSTQGTNLVGFNELIMIMCHAALSWVCCTPRQYLKTL